MTSDPLGAALAPGRADSHIVLGLGLTRLGRPWGVNPMQLPDAHEAAALLEDAIALGIRVFDTAPSYGASERRLGQTLAGLDPALRSQLFIATKCGESWDPATDTLTVDHSYDALARSIDTSLCRLGRIDLLQLHRSNADALLSDDVRRAFALARSLGVGAVGASVSTVADARIAVEALGVDWLQWRYHVGNDYMKDAFAVARQGGCQVLINRPFAMGRLAYDSSGGRKVDDAALASAFAFILDEDFTGAILTGTASRLHLRENCAAFAHAKAHG